MVMVDVFSQTVSTFAGPHPQQAQTCELCMGQLTLDPAVFDLEAYCRRYYPQVS